MPDRVESFGEVDSDKNRLRAWLEFDKPIRNGLRKTKNLIQSKTVEGGNRPGGKREWS